MTALGKNSLFRNSIYFVAGANVQSFRGGDSNLSFQRIKELSSLIGANTKLDFYILTFSKD